MDTHWHSFLIRFRLRREILPSLCSWDHRLKEVPGKQVECYGRNPTAEVSALVEQGALFLLFSYLSWSEGHFLQQWEQLVATTIGQTTADPWTPAPRQNDSTAWLSPLPKKLEKTVQLHTQNSGSSFPWHWHSVMPECPKNSKIQDSHFFVMTLCFYLPIRNVTKQSRP